MTSPTDLLNYRDHFPHAPGFKERNGTSQEAAESIRGRADIIREQCYERVEEAGATGITADECAAILGLSVLTVRPRFSELYAAKRIVKSGRRRPNASQHSAHVWILPAHAEPEALAA